MIVAIARQNIGSRINGITGSLYMYTDASLKCICIYACVHACVPDPKPSPNLTCTWTCTFADTQLTCNAVSGGYKRLPRHAERSRASTHSPIRCQVVCEQSAHACNDSLNMIDPNTSTHNIVHVSSILPSKVVRSSTRATSRIRSRQRAWARICDAINAKWRRKASPSIVPATEWDLKKILTRYSDASKTRIGGARTTVCPIGGSFAKSTSTPNVVGERALRTDKIWRMHFRVAVRKGCVGHEWVEVDLHEENVAREEHARKYRCLGGCRKLSNWFLRRYQT